LFCLLAANRRFDYVDHSTFVTNRDLTVVYKSPWLGHAVFQPDRAATTGALQGGDGGHRHPLSGVVLHEQMEIMPEAAELKIADTLTPRRLLLSAVVG
jgi:hypothetical protein